MDISDFFRNLFITILCMAVVILIAWGMDNFFANMSGGTVLNWSSFYSLCSSLGFFGWFMATMIFAFIFVVVAHSDD